MPTWSACLASARAGARPFRPGTESSTIVQPLLLTGHETGVCAGGGGGGFGLVAGVGSGAAGGGGGGGGGARWRSPWARPARLWAGAGGSGGAAERPVPPPRRRERPATHAADRPPATT